MKNLMCCLLVFYGFFCQLYSQKNGVEIIEDKQKKRHLIYAKNTSDIPKSVFLKVNAIGYRRSADRPIIKIVPPNSQLLMITLIPLIDKESSYTYIFAANDEQDNLGINRKKARENLNVEVIMKSELVLFTKDNCEKCKMLIDSLRRERVKHREVNIDLRDRFYQYIWQLLAEKGYETNSVLLPFASVKGELVHPILDIKSFVQSVK